ncbi:hypothetical protein N0V88_002839 [Collariella sp. IMI 366227]|nr:hypothetical protein N0V88_002839 [Collariella sp. IMI 366227]
MSISQGDAPGKADSQPDEKAKAVVAQRSSPEGSEVSNIAEVVVEDPDRMESSKLPFSKARCIALVAILTGASFLNSLSGQAVVIILPTIGKHLDIPEARLQWILSAYSLTFGCFLLFWGRVGDIYGKRIIFIGGSAWFAVTTLVNPFLPNEIAFDLFRGLQGLAKNYAFSCYSAGAPLGAVCGNLLGGIIAEYTSWKWVATIDWLGAFLITTGLLALLFALTEGNVVGWSTPWIPVLIVVSLALVTLFVFWQHHLEKTGKLAPIMKVSNFRNKQFSAAMAIMAFFFSSFMGFMVYATYFYQDYQGLSPLQTTLRFLPTGVVGFFTAVIVSQLLSRIPAYVMLAVGNLCVSISALLFAIPIPPDTTYWAWAFPAMAISVFGADTAWPCLILFTSRSLPQSDQALGGALVNSMGQVGRAIGLAVATAIQTAVMARERGVRVQDVGSVEEWDEASLLGLRAAEWWHVGLGLCSLCVVLLAFRGSGIIGKVEAPKVEESAQSDSSRDPEAGKAFERQPVFMDPAAF